MCESVVKSRVEGKKRFVYSRQTHSIAAFQKSAKMASDVAKTRVSKA
jgi:hypothetical protein